MTRGTQAEKWRFIYRGLKARYRDQRVEIAPLVKSLSPRDIAVDVGANKGSYVWSLSRAVPLGRTVAFEPQPVLADYLSRACRAAGLRNVVIEAKGVSKASGALTLAIPGQAESSPDASFQKVADGAANRRIEVPTVSLDDYFRGEKSRIGAMKIDVEGHEFSVLSGADGLLRAHKPTIVMECEQRHLSGITVREVIDHLLSRGYDGFFIDRRSLRPVREFDATVHQREDEGRFWDRPDYANNFLFTSNAAASL